MIDVNRTLADKIAEEVRTAMETIAAKHGLQFERGGGRYTGTEFRIANIKFVAPASNGNVQRKGVTAREESDFKMYAPMSGISADALGFTFRDGNDQLTVVGWCSRKRKNPIQLQNQDGKGFKAPVGYLKGHLTAELKKDGYNSDGSRGPRFNF